jgi:hypothetical protein
MHALVSGKVRATVPARTFLMCAGATWMGPGIALTDRRGGACIPVANEVVRFWITRLHGPAANDSSVL